jgi:hypothetical protein
LYQALRTENPYISPYDAKDRIEKDLAGIWSKRTILDALPDEAKDKEKQEAGRLGQKKRNSAAFSAAPQMEKEITLGADGTRIVESTGIANPTTSPSVDVSTDKTDTEIPKQPESEKYSNHISEKLGECQNCKELYAENLELKEALKEASPLITADKVVSASPSTVSIGYNHAVDDILEIEFPLFFVDIHNYMAQLYPKIGDCGKIWFSCRINTKTGRVISANLGRIQDERTDVSRCKGHSITSRRFQSEK